MSQTLYEIASSAIIRMILISCVHCVSKREPPAKRKKVVWVRERWANNRSQRAA